MYLACSLLLALWTPLAGATKVKPSVRYAPSWDEAVAEAKLLNVPLVVHNHGFY